VVAGEDPLWQAIPIAPAKIGEVLEERAGGEEPSLRPRPAR
jgi:hypothetical protein